MSLWHSFCENVLVPVGGAIDTGVCAVGRGIDAVVTTVVIDGVGGGIDNAIDFVKENAIDELVASLKSAYEKEMELPLTYYIASIENGTEKIA